MTIEGQHVITKKNIYLDQGIIMKLIIGLVALLSLSQAFASELKIVKVRELGTAKNKVIFQSSDIKKINKSNVVRGKIVAQWGTDVFEVVTVFYTCNTKNVCKLSDYERVATFESCVVKKKTVLCSNKLSGDNETEGSKDVKFDAGPDSIQDDVRDSHLDTDFPVRIEDEFADLF